MSPAMAVERREGGVDAGIEALFGGENNFKTALLFYKLMVAHSSRLIMLCDGARVLVWGDRPETISR
jgi:hypothetical protein